MSTNPLRNPLVVVVVGVLLGLVAGAGVGAVVWLALSGAPETLPPSPAVERYAIEASVTEAYINRIMVQSANEMGGPVSLSDGHMDLHPGGTADFAVKLKVGPLEPVFDGTVGFRATDDHRGIEVVLLDARFGRLGLRRLVPANILSDINAELKLMLVDRIGSQGLEILGVASDEDSLRVYLGSRE